MSKKSSIFYSHMDNGFAKRLKELRGEKPQAQFAKELGIPFSSYRRYEAGTTFPPMHILNRIAKKLGLSVNWLLRGRDIVRGELQDLKEDIFPDFSPEKIVHFLENYQRLIRIYREDSALKIDAVRAFLQMLDPIEMEKKKAGKKKGA